MAFWYLLNLCSSLYLMGLIWTVQLVHYPSFRYIDPESFADFSSFHQSSITWIVAPVMIVELGSSLYLCSLSAGDWKLVLLAMMVGLVWCSTFFLSVPLHSALAEKGFDPILIEKLISTNWPRTLLWTLKSSLMLILLRSYV